MAGEFVEGWLVAQVLGEGSYGEVRLLVNARTGASVALKTVRGGTAAREAALHRALRHPRVLRCLGERTHPPLHYMFLEYAQGGELFDRIEPDVGMPEPAARRYWLQLLEGIQYLQSRGVAHRDLKPENLLLDCDDNLKISDFGMATLFRHAGSERLLSRVCGTLPYAAPEVLAAASVPYRAPPADLWAAAVVLLAMLAGELPWERAHVDCPGFVSWSRGAITAPVWSKLTTKALVLLRRALHVEPKKRYTVEELLRHPWTVASADETDSAPEEVSWRGWSSQPTRVPTPAALSEAELGELLRYSQPASSDELLLATQSDRHTPDQSVMQRLVRRMTRVWVRVSEEAALAAVQACVEQRGWPWQRVHPRIVSVECGAGLRLRAWALRAAGGGVLVEFRRSRGCGLQFKRRFLELKKALQSISVPPPSMCEDLLAPPINSQEAMDET